MRRMRSRIILLVLSLVVLVCSSCSQVHSLTSESGLYDVELRHSPKALVDGGWTWGGGNPYLNKKKGAICITPLDVSKVVKDEPELAPLMVSQMQDYIVKYVGDALKAANEANHQHWVLTDKPEQADIRVDMALVDFRPQNPFLRILSNVLSPFSKVPGMTGVVGSFAQGDICIELTIRDVRTGKLFLACKDSNRKKTRLISADAYKKSGNADVNLRGWAKKLGGLIRYCAPDQLGDGKLRDKIRERSYSDILKEYLE